MVWKTTLSVTSKYAPARRNVGSDRRGPCRHPSPNKAQPPTVADAELSQFAPQVASVRLIESGLDIAVAVVRIAIPFFERDHRLVEKLPIGRSPEVCQRRQGIRHNWCNRARYALKARNEFSEAGQPRFRTRLHITLALRSVQSSAQMSGRPRSPPAWSSP